MNLKRYIMETKKLKISLVLLLLIVMTLNCAFPFINDNTQYPRKVVTIIIDLNRQQEFFDQLYKFAEENGFSILIDTLSSSDEEFQIYMRRDDIIISGVSMLNEYQIGFSDVTTHPPSSDSVFDDLVKQLESYVSEIPGTTFSIIND